MVDGPGLQAQPFLPPPPRVVAARTFMACAHLQPHHVQPAHLFSALPLASPQPASPSAGSQVTRQIGNTPLTPLTDPVGWGAWQLPLPTAGRGKGLHWFQAWFCSIYSSAASPPPHLFGHKTGETTHCRLSSLEYT